MDQKRMSKGLEKKGFCKSEGKGGGLVVAGNYRGVPDFLVLLRGQGVKDF